MGGRTGKARSFAFLIYPDSWHMWESDLKGLHMPVVVSPLHDRDEWTEEDEAKDPEHKAGTLKKPHRHAVISWGNATTLRNALNTLEPFGVTYVEPVSNFAGYCRYLCHMDNPEKAQYDLADVVCLGGAAPDYERRLTGSEVLAQRDEIMAMCEENGVAEYADLCDFCRKHRPDWRRDVYEHTIFWRGYFASLRSRWACEGRWTAGRDGAGDRSKEETEVSGDGRRDGGSD